ncbi:MAG: nucleoside monophosphate kinase [Candidatus Berkelbacteria bacterium]|nr:nucleoside monophosphate kinase [Candidatus Berkelbacteria bacterium]MCR4307614.1 nucleoside monophosphate kinase [Candidatus Berkelbacteria bacterium]
MGNNLTVFVMFGPQGSGKSTQVERLASKLNLKVFEAGEALRTRSQIDENIHLQLKQGILVADETMREIIEEFISDNTTKTGYVFDGYPRNVNQFEGFMSLVTKYHWEVVGIFINLSDESAKKRLSTRFQIIDGQKVFREDDKPEIVQNRLDTFKRETLPLKAKFLEVYNLLEIDGEPPVDTVTSEISEAVDRFLNDANK